MTWYHPPVMTEETIEPDDPLEFLIQVCVRGAGEIRDRLRVDETGFQHVVGSAHFHARDFYLYGVMDEVERAGIALLRQREILQGEAMPGKDPRIERNVVGSVLTEQAAWSRKLTELLVEMLGFRGSNTQPYFRHYLLLREYEGYAKLQSDFRDFHNCDNRNMRSSMELLEAHILRTESELDLARCSYLKAKMPWKVRAPGAKRDVFSSFRNRLIAVLSVGDASTKLVLGFSHEEFTRQSRALHGQVGGPHYDQTLDDVRKGCSHIGMLAMHLVLNARRLARIRAKTGLGGRLAGLSRTDPRPAELVRFATQPRIQKGDFVLAYGDLAEVLAVKRSRFGYKTFRIRYLDHSPLPDVTDEEFPARYVRLLFRRVDVTRQLRGVVASVDPRRTPSSRGIAQSLRKSVVQLWRDGGLREYLNGRMDLAEERLASLRDSFRTGNGIDGTGQESK